MAAEQPWLAPAPGTRELSHNVLWEEEALQERPGQPGDTSGGFGGVRFQSPMADDPDTVII